MLNKGIYKMFRENHRKKGINLKKQKIVFRPDSEVYKIRKG